MFFSLLLLYLQVQNLALHSATRAVSVKSEAPDRKDGASIPLAQQQQQQLAFSQAAQQQQQQQQVQPQRQQVAKPNFTQQSSANTIAAKTGNQAGVTVTPAASVAPSTTSSAALPLSQLLLSSSAAPMILVPTSNVATTSTGYSIGPVAPKATVGAQTLVVQPLQQTSAGAEKGLVPIQPKTALGHRLPAQLSTRQPTPILPAPPSQVTAGGNGTPHIPVQLVGARPGLGGSVQAVALAQVRSGAAQESAANGSLSSVPNNSATVRLTLHVLNPECVSVSQCDGSSCSFPSTLLDKTHHRLSEEKIRL